MSSNPMKDENVRSLAYRKNQRAIWNGMPPHKYLRLIPHIARGRILEVGSAEGVLSLLLGERGDVVTGLELRDERHQEALKLRDRWCELGHDVSNVNMEKGSVLDKLHLLETHETVVAIRSIYYLRDSAQSFMNTAFERGVKHVTLCGNKNRAKQYRDDPKSELGQFNRLASVDGMCSLISLAGFKIVNVIEDGDPIVVGRRST